MSKNQPDDKLPEVVAGLEMLSVTNGLSPTQSTTKRVLRKRVPKPGAVNSQYSANGANCQEALLNRRCNQRPKKRTFNEMKSEEDIKLYYLDKTVKRLPHSLETIYEEDEKVSFDTYARPHMSTKRFKRMINFQVNPSDSKQKKRRLKAKKVFGSKFFKSRRMDMKDVLKKLELIHSTSSTEIENEE